MKNYITEHARDAVLGIDLEGRIAYCNQAACNFLGFTTPELTGKSYDSIRPPSSPLRFHQLLTAILNQEWMDPCPEEQITKNGDRIKVIVQYSPVINDQGKTIGISSTFRKVSIFEKAVSKAQDLLETAPDAMVIVNKQGQIVLINAQTEKMFGYNKQELLGNAVEILIPDEFMKSHQSHRDRYMEKPKTRGMGEGMNLSGKKKSGETFPVEVSLSPLKTDEGLFVSAAIRDISSRKQYEKELADSNRMLQAKNRELEQLAYVASHDLQEPLRTVNCYTNLLAKNYGHHFDDIGQKSMRFITDATDRMSRLIEGLQTYTRIGLHRDLTEIDCNQVVYTILSELEPVIEKTCARVDVESLPALKVYPSDFRMLFQHLLSNALKFKKLEISPAIKIRAEKKKDHWLFSVQDNGIGIAPEHRDHIFVIYKRLTNKIEGTGIGLANCRKIVELHGGKIWVEGEPGFGSTFYFTIPS